jgi:ATP-dependent DNA ligase
VRTGRPVGHIPPCLPSRAERPPAGPEWLHEIKHDGFRIMARRNDNAGAAGFLILRQCSTRPER